MLHATRRLPLVVSAAAAFLLGLGGAHAASASARTAPPTLVAQAEPSPAQPLPTQPELPPQPAPPDVQPPTPGPTGPTTIININHEEPVPGPWYARPFWIAIFVIAGMLFVVLIALAMRSGPTQQGTTIVK